MLSSALLPAFHCLMPASEPTLAASASGVESAGAGSFFSHFLMRFRGDRWLISAEAASVLIAGGFLPFTAPVGVPGTLSMPAPADLVCLPPRVGRESDSAHAYTNQFNLASWRVRCSSDAFLTTGTLRARAPDAGRGTHRVCIHTHRHTYRRIFIGIAYAYAYHTHTHTQNKFSATAYRWGGRQIPKPKAPAGQQSPNFPCHL